MATPTGWSAIYRDILDHFGWDEADDAAAARVLHELLPRDAWKHIGTELKHRPVATVVGRAPALDELRPAEMPGVVIAADGAVGRLREMGVTPRVVVTDLDGAWDDLQWAAAQGCGMVVHAHGHNIDRLPQAASLGAFVVGTYQCTPQPGFLPLRNLGGFTDGDRAVRLCRHYGVQRIHLAAFDLDAPVPSTTGDVATKAAKLRFARRIVEDVAREVPVTGAW